MGCWNGTCAITNLPIIEGDDVAVLFIKNIDLAHRASVPEDSGIMGPSGGPYVYPTDEWTPVTLPFFSKYDDYGGVYTEPEQMVIDPWNQEIIEKFFADKIVEYDLGDNQYHDVAISRDDMTISTAMAAIHEGRLHIKPYGHKVALSFILIHKWVYDHYTNIDTAVSWAGNSITEKCLTDLETFSEPLPSAEEINKQVKILTKGEVYANLDADVADAVDELLMIRPRAFMNSGYNMVSDSLKSRGFYMAHYLHAATDIHDRAIKRELGLAAIKLGLLNESMSSLRKKFTPQCGSGSQDTSWEKHMQLGDMISKYAAERIAENEADWEE